jgi:O-antigen/teichoic acid export membrane protein
VSERVRRAEDGAELRLHSQAARGAVSNYVGQLVVLTTGVLLTPIVLHNVGPGSYALWILATSLAGYGGLLDLGISSTLQKYVAEHRARAAPHELSYLVSTAVALYALLGVIAAGIVIALARLVPGLFDVAADHRSAAMWLIVLVGLQVAISLPAAAPTAVLRGAQRFELSNLLVVVGTLLTAGLTVFVLAIGGGIIAVAAVGVAVTAAMQLPAVVLARRAVPELRLGLAGIDRRRIFSVFSFSVSVFTVRLAAVLTRRTDPIVIGAALPVQAITPFALAQRLPEAVSLLTNQFVQILLPLASELDARDERATLRAVYLAATRVALSLSLALGATMAILGSSILDIWVGDAYSRYGHLVAILAGAAIVDTLGWPAASMLTGMGRHRPLAWMAIANGVAKVSLSVVLVTTIGLTGVALATLIPTVLQTTLLVLPYSLRAIGVQASEFVTHVLGRNVVPAVVICSVLIAARTLVDTDRPEVLTGTVLLALTAYGVAYMRFSAGVLERRFYRGLRASTWSTLSRAARN